MLQRGQLCKGIYHTFLCRQFGAKPVDLCPADPATGESGHIHRSGSRLAKMSSLPGQAEGIYLCSSQRNRDDYALKEGDDFSGDNSGDGDVQADELSEAQHRRQTV